MKRFSDFGIKPTDKGLVGDKIKIQKILNKEISVHDFRVVDSKFEGKGKCLHLQFEIGNSMHIIFTGAAGLIETIEKIPKEEFPFSTTIVIENERFLFT